MKKKITTFVHVFVNSLLPLDSYYRKLKNVRFTFSLKYFLTIMLIISFLSVLSPAVSFIFRNPPWHLAGAISNSLKDFPSDLVITIRQGNLITNYDRPYILWLQNGEVPTPLLVIDEFSTASKQEQYSSPILLTGSSIALNFQNTTQVIPIDKTLNLSFSKKNAQELDRAFSRLKIIIIFTIPFLLLAIGVLYFFLTATIALVLLSILSAVVFVIARLKIVDLKYSKVYQISLHSATLPLILGSAISILGLTMPIKLWIPGVYILFLGAAIFEVYLAGPKRS